MSRRKATTDSTAGDEAVPTFEEAITTLEAIVEAMENDHLPLEDLVTHYEKGTTLLDRCEAILNSAKGRIELITLRNQREIALDSSARSADTPSSPDTPDQDEEEDEDENDIRLF